MNRLLIAALSLSVLTGCYWDGAGLGSADGRFEYASTVHTPYTVKLLDTSTGETLWSYEVPVGKTLSLRFLQGHDAEATGQDVMKWEVFPTKRVGSSLVNSMPCPPASSRIVKVYIREQPEAYANDAIVVQGQPMTESVAQPATNSPAAPVAEQHTEPAKAPESSSMVVPPDPNQPAPSESKPAEPAPTNEPKR